MHVRAGGFSINRDVIRVTLSVSRLGDSGEWWCGLHSEVVHTRQIVHYGMTRMHSVTLVVVFLPAIGDYCDEALQVCIRSRLETDYYSKYPFVYSNPRAVTSANIISRRKSLFAEQGVPQRVMSDNGGHYTSDYAFRKLAYHCGSIVGSYGRTLARSGAEGWKVI